MFVTLPTFEQYVPAGLGGPDCRYWRAVGLSLETPWYLCVRRGQGGEPSTTTLVAWEADLLDLVNSNDEAGCGAIARLDKSADGAGRWTLRWIDAIWLASNDEREEVGLVLQLEGEPLPTDEHLQAVRPRNDRTLIFRDPRAAR